MDITMQKQAIEAYLRKLIGLLEEDQETFKCSINGDIYVEYTKLLENEIQVCLDMLHIIRSTQS